MPNEETTSRRTADAVVVGAGVIGCSIALELAKAGRSVLVVDKAGGVAHGSTSASSAIVRFSYSTLAGVATAWESKFCWESWGEHLGIPDPQTDLQTDPRGDPQSLARFLRTGMLHLDVPVAPRSEMLPLFDEVGVAYEELDAEALAARFPALDNGRYWPNKPVTDDAFWADSAETLGAVYTPDAGFVDDPRLAAGNLAAAAYARGAELRFHAPVTALDRHRSGDWRVRLGDGTSVHTPVVVNAAGPWSGALNRLAGVGAEFTVAVRPLRQEVHEVSAPDGYGGEGDGLGPTVADLDLGVYLRPGQQHTLLVGGTEPACDELEWVDDPDAADPRVTLARHELQLTRAARRVPDLRVPNRPVGIAGVYDVAEDWTPIYDRTDAEGFYVAMGTSGNQFKNAPLVGRFLAAIIDGVEGGHDHDREPLAYTGEHTGCTIDLGAFSRRRPLNAASSGTVMG